MERYHEVYRNIEERPSLISERGINNPKLYRVQILIPYLNLIINFVTMKKVISWFKDNFNKQCDCKEEEHVEEQETEALEETLEEANKNIKEIEELIEEIDELLYLELYEQIENELEKMNPHLTIETRIEKLEKFASNQCR